MAIRSTEIAYSEATLKQVLKDAGIAEPDAGHVNDLWYRFRILLNSLPIEELMKEAAYRVYDHERLMGRTPNIRV